MTVSKPCLRCYVIQCHFCHARGRNYLNSNDPTAGVTVSRRFRRRGARLRTSSTSAAIISCAIKVERPGAGIMGSGVSTKQLLSTPEDGRADRAASSMKNVSVEPPITGVRALVTMWSQRAAATLGPSQHPQRADELRRDEDLRRTSSDSLRML